MEQQQAAAEQLRRRLGGQLSDHQILADGFSTNERLRKQSGATYQRSEQPGAVYQLSEQPISPDYYEVTTVEI